MDLKVDDHGLIITLSRRNLLALLTKLDDPSSLKTLYKPFDDYFIVIKAEDDDVHYINRTPGEMSPRTEHDIAATNDYRA